VPKLPVTRHDLPGTTQHSRDITDSEMLRSHPSNVFVLKYYAPLILFGGTFVFWSVGFRWAQLIFLIPLILGVVFYASLAVLQIPDGTVRYRRAFAGEKLITMKSLTLEFHGRYLGLVTCG
jgi:hypothetical protein